MQDLFCIEIIFSEWSDFVTAKIEWGTKDKTVGVGLFGEKKYFTTDIV